MTTDIKVSTFNSRQLYTTIPFKSSHRPTKEIYSEAYANACNAVNLDIATKYVEARDAYKSVIKVRTAQNISCVKVPYS